MSTLSQSVTAGFVPTTGDQNRDPPVIQITGHEGVGSPDFGIPLRCYPPNCKIVASVGEIRRGNTLEVECQGEMLHWSDTSAHLKFYPTSAPTIELVFGFDDKGDLVLPAQVQFTVDTGTGIIRSSKAFRGLVRVSEYNSQYELFYYKPKIDFAKIPKSEFVGLNITFGSIAAYKDGGLTIFDVPATSLVDGTDKVEIYRVVSQSVITTDGEWEKPETWDGTYTGTYTSGQTGPDKDNSATKERVHEIGYIARTGGSLWYEKFSHGLAKPYAANLIKAAGTNPFQPVITLRTQNTAQLFKDDASLRGRADGFIAARQTTPLI